VINLNIDIIFPKFSSEITHISLSPGIHCIYGESGAGKSNFLNQLDSFEPDNSSSSNQFQIISSNIHQFSHYKVHQNPDSQIIGRTVEGELAFNGECLGLPYEKLDYIVKNGLEKLPNNINSSLNPGYLSGGEKELMNLLTAMSSDSNLLLIDDSLSFLSIQNKSLAIEWLKEWARLGKYIIWVTSEINDLNHCDSGWELLSDKLLPCKTIHERRYELIQIPTGDMTLNFTNVIFKYEHSRLLLNQFNLNVHDVRSFGLIGGNGSGKTTLAGLIFKDLTPNSGQISLSLSGKTDLKIGYADQFPEHLIQLKTPSELVNELIHSTLFNQNQLVTFQNRLSRFGIQWNQIQNIKGVELPWATLRTIVVVMLSQCSFDILILDEPTFGLGWNQRLTLLAFLRQMMTKMHFIVVSHDRAFVEAFCDSVVDLNTFQLKHARSLTTEKAEA